MPQQTIPAKTKALLTELRAHSTAQRELWRLIPLLALQADGRSGGWLDSYSRAYHNGFWAINSSQSGGSYLAYVDLATGRLVNSYATGRPASDEALLPLLLRPEELEAQPIIAMLQAQIRKPVDSRFHSKENEKYPGGYAAYVEDHARKLQHDLGLGQRYIRRRST